MKKPIKIILISGITLVALCSAYLAIFHPFFLLWSISSFFSKSYNDDLPFSSKGVYLYNNIENSNIQIKEMYFYIEEYKKEHIYDVVFEHSKNITYGIDFDIIFKNNVSDNYVLSFEKKVKSLRYPKHYTYLYYFELKHNDSCYEFNLNSLANESLYLTFIGSNAPSYVIKNELIKNKE